MSRNHLVLDPKRWQQVRRKVFDRDGYRCVQCRHSGRLECDHIVPLDQGGELYDPVNLQSLCKSCHVRKTRTENRRQLTLAEQGWQRLVSDLLL